jgi:hypothetical protein
MDPRSTDLISARFRRLRDRIAPIGARVLPIGVLALALLVAACGNGNGGGSGY